MPERFNLQVTCEDDWKSVAELASVPGLNVIMTEGTVSATSNAAYLVFGQTRPETGDVGLNLPVDGGVGLGPASVLNGYPASQVWVRNKAAASNAVVTMTGVKA